MTQKRNMQLSNRRNLLEWGTQNELKEQKNHLQTRKTGSLQNSQGRQHTTYKHKSI